MNRFLKSVAKGDGREDMLNTWAPADKATGERQFDVGGRPDKLARATLEQDQVIREAISAYRHTRRTKGPAKQAACFKVRGIARRLGAGTGSLGKARFYVLIQTGKRNSSSNYLGDG